ncbi:MAG: Wzz/FepE/Etk N-terminal domain-containing protein [Pseudomonadota bacterium]|nr:Wzz/FepE/Etk N-terminal domain-containing protein [Pseudomonadota bacterium]
MQNNQERTAYDDEIGLVDLAATFIRRRRVFYVVFTFVTLLGVLYAFLKADTYEYITLIECAEEAGGEFLQKPATTVAIIQNRWVPEISTGYQAQHDADLSFKVQASNPENTGLIRIASESAVENAGIVENVHNTVAGSIMNSQKRLLEIRQNSLKRQIASMDQIIQSLKSSEANENTSTALASAIQKRAELESELEALQPASVLVVARQSSDQNGTSDMLIVTLAVLLGGMLGVFLAFFAEFVAQVRQSLEKMQND